MTELATDVPSHDEAASVEPSAPVPAQDELLVEDVSIDGMCGVY